MMLAGKLNLAQNAVYSEDTNNFYGTQIQVMQSDEVRTGAEALVGRLTQSYNRLR